MAGYFAYIKWYDSCSVVFNICSGVRQGAVLWPILFAIYVDDISKLFWASDEGFKIVSCVASQTQYLHAIQIWRVIRWPLFFFKHLRTVLIMLRDTCNARFGPRYDKNYANINTCDGRQITCSKELRYIGIFIVSSRIF